MSKDKKVAGIVKLVLTIKKLTVAGIYEDGTQFQFSLENDSKVNRKFFDKANQFVAELYSEMLQGS